MEKDGLTMFERSGCGIFRLAIVAGCVMVGGMAQSGDAIGQVLQNRDDVGRSVTIRAKSMRRRLDVGPGETIRDFCADGCVIRIDEDDARDFLIEGNERLSIEGGLVYFDGEVAKQPEGDAAAGSDGSGTSTEPR